MSYLNNEEKKIAVRLLTDGYKKAAESFAAITKHPVRILPTKVEITNDGVQSFKNFKNDEELIVITTTIIGEHNGISYLILNEMEAEEIYKSCMPYNHEKASRVMETEALLKELDNILSAAVITEFSNFLDTMIFGDVPLLTRTNQLSMREIMMENNKGDIKLIEYYMIADTQFVFDNNSKLSPQFIWKLSESFMKGIKKVKVEGKKFV